MLRMAPEEYRAKMRTLHRLLDGGADHSAIRSGLAKANRLGAKSSRPPQGRGEPQDPARAVYRQEL